MTIEEEIIEAKADLVLESIYSKCRYISIYRMCVGIIKYDKVTGEFTIEN